MGWGRPIGYMGPSERAVFDLSLGEMGVIAVLVIVFVGPDGLPDLMRVLGRFYGQARRASDDLRRTFNAEVARVDTDRRRDELRLRREARERQAADRPTADGVGGDRPTADAPGAVPVPVGAPPVGAAARPGPGPLPTPGPVSPMPVSPMPVPDPAAPDPAEH